MTVPDEVDIIVCGGGSCGCVVAGRFVSHYTDQTYHSAFHNVLIKNML